MKNITITEIAGKDVVFDQTIDSDTTIASNGAIAVAGNVDDSALNTGINTGVIAGNDVSLDDSIIGKYNTQINDSAVGAYASQGSSATNAVGQNVNLGSGDLNDVDAGGDAQVVTGHFNDVRGDVTATVSNTDGPVNLAAGDGNSQQAIEDNSTNLDNVGNTSVEIDDSFNKVFDLDVTETYETTRVFDVEVDDSFNQVWEDNDVVQKSWTQDFDYEVEMMDYDGPAPAHMDEGFDF